MNGVNAFSQAEIVVLRQGHEVKEKHGLVGACESPDKSCGKGQLLDPIENLPHGLILDDVIAEPLADVLRMFLRVQKGRKVPVDFNVP